MVRFSVDGVDASFEKLRGVEYDTVATNIEGFLGERNRGGYKTRVELNVTYMPEHLPGVEAVHDRWAGKVDFINYQGVISIPTMKVSNRIDHAHRRPGCRQIYRSAFFLTNGTVAPCCADFNGELVLGTENTSQNAFAIMNSPKSRELRRMHRNGTVPAICAACTQYHSNIFPRQQSSIV